MLQPLEFNKVIKFNSATSCKLLDDYNSYYKSELELAASDTPGKTFRPSFFRCNRYSWFKLRGTKVNTTKVNPSLSFTAELGTFCHETLQKRLKSMLGVNWIDVSEYIKSATLPFECTCEYRSEYETAVIISEPPFKFACDGIIRLNGKTYLLEIKTSELNSFTNLTEPKPEHIDQINCYATLLNLPDVLVIYQDRVHGEIKVFEHTLSSLNRQDILDRIKLVVDAVKSNIAPNGLPVGDKYCAPYYCPYYLACVEYGRN